MHRAALTVLALATLTLAAGCGSKSRSTTTSTSSSTVSPLSSASGSPTGSSSTTGTSAGGPTGSGPSAGTRAPTSGPGAASMLPGPTSQGSRFWYVNDAFGNPFKTHDAQEASLAAEVLTLVNQERANAGLAPLAADSQAERAAKVHCEDMEGRGFFSHTTPEGWSPSDRLTMTGASGFNGWGENIALGQTTAQSVMNSWMNSAGHRANILGNFTHIGVGVAVGPGGPRWCQVFLSR